MQHPAISAILVGCRSADEVEKNVALYDDVIEAEIWSEFKTFLQSS